MLYAAETGISSNRLGLWLKCAFTLPTGYQVLKYSQRLFPEGSFLVVLGIYWLMWEETSPLKAEKRRWQAQIIHWLKWRSRKALEATKRLSFFLFLSSRWKNAYQSVAVKGERVTSIQRQFTTQFFKQIQSRLNFLIALKFYYSYYSIEHMIKSTF